MTESQLQARLDLLRSGDLNAFEELYAELNQPLFTVILRIVGHRAAAEDILQEVFLKLYQSPPPPSVRKPRAYLFQMARNLAIDSLRTQHPAVPLDDLALQGAPGPDRDFALDVSDALAALPQRQRQVVSLHLDGGLKFREIAQITETPLGTVLWQYRQAVDRLRTLLGGTV
jgi:RNA polymerase sigma-70 factor (ECF subfamily)